MSTVPHNTHGAVNSDRSALVLHAAGHDLDAAVCHFEATADGLGAARPASNELTKLTRQVAALTTELFPGRLVVETDVDPEIPDDVCLLFQVDADGSVEEIVALDNAWHRRVLAVATQWSGLFCLSIDAH